MRIIIVLLFVLSLCACNEKIIYRDRVITNTVVQIKTNTVYKTIEKQIVRTIAMPIVSIRKQHVTNIIEKKQKDKPRLILGGGYLFDYMKPMTSYSNITFLSGLDYGNMGFNLTVGLKQCTAAVFFRIPQFKKEN
jgi:hypothetical protein